MKLIVKQPEGADQEFSFEQGPIYLGRQMGSTVFLRDRSVSRQHAVIFATKEGQWVLEDLDSANKSYVNGKAIHKSPIGDGDKIGIGCYTIEVQISTKAEPKRFEPPEKPIPMDETVVAVRHDVATVERKIDAKKGEAIQMPARRFGDLDRAAGMLCRAHNLNELHRTVLDILLKQLGAYHAWAAVRKDPDGAMDVQGGRDQTTVQVMRQELAMQQAVTDAIEQRKYLLVPQLPREVSDGKIRSIVVAPIVRNSGCFGVLYAENSTDHEHYTREDLDYLILVSILVAAVVEKA